MPARIREAVTAPTVEERVRRYTPPISRQPGLYDWIERDIERQAEYFVFPSG